MRGTIEERFWAKVTKTETCWLWTASTNQYGYGLFWINGKVEVAHRVAYELLVGPIPKGLTLDHVWARGCTHKNCVNPAHLEAVTLRVNILRSNCVSARAAAVTHCPTGHAYAGENLIVRKDGSRSCRSCKRDAWAATGSQRRRDRKAAQRLAA